MTDLADAVARLVIEGDPHTLHTFAQELDSGLANALSHLIRSRPSSADPHTMMLLSELARAAEHAELPSPAIASMLEVGQRVRAHRQQTAQTATLVWTGPELHESAMRSTVQTLSDLIDRSTSQILMVTYSLRPETRNIDNRLISHLAHARQRGVGVTLVVHKDDANRRALRETWPENAPGPKLLTWPVPEGDEMVKLHAKIAASDDREILITSANLTYHGLFANLELGILVEGSVAGGVRRHFDRLQRYGHLLEWD